MWRSSSARSQPSAARREAIGVAKRDGRDRAGAPRLRHRAGRRGDHGGEHVHPDRRRHRGIGRDAGARRRGRGNVHARPRRARGRDDGADEGDRPRAPLRPVRGRRGDPRHAEEHGLVVVEDAAQAHGAACATAGEPGRSAAAAAFSFYPTKNLGALGDGGAIVTGDPKVAAAARELRSFGERAGEAVRRGQQQPTGSAPGGGPVGEARQARIVERPAARARVDLPLGAPGDAWSCRRRLQGRTTSTTCS